MTNRSMLHYVIDRPENYYRRFIFALILSFIVLCLREGSMMQTYHLLSMRFLVAGALLTGSFFVSSSAKASSDQVGHHLTGRVWISPVCAGAQREGDLCRKPLADIEVRMNDSEGHFVASAKTDVNGVFFMAAPTGLYLLHIKSPTKIMRCTNLSISLPMPKPLPVELECDSGMR